MSKYQSLADHLTRQDADQVFMTFAEIENVLGFPLPASARQFPAWWANQAGGGHSQCQAWLTTGWRTRGVDITRETLAFERENASANQPGMAETGHAFQAPFSAAPRVALSLMAERLLADYRAEAGGNEGAAIARALHEAAVARRVRLLDAITPTGRVGGVDSVDLIREDRDAR